VGRSIIVTGAGSGMGAAMVEEFLSLGDRVAAMDLRPEGITKRFGDDESVRAIGVDVGDEASVKSAVFEALSYLGGVDVLCNNAGILDGYTPALETSSTLWNRVMATNLTGPFLVSRAVLDSMVKQGHGVIINTASIAAFVAGGGGAAYTSAKHGLLGLTKQLAFDYGKFNIRVNAICPGAIRTSMTAHLHDPNNANPHVDAAIAATPAGRWGEPEEIAKLAAFLASENAEFIHGAGVLIDGGWTIS